MYDCRWVVKPQYVLDEEAAKKAWQTAAKTAKEPGAGPADVAAAEAAYQEYLAKKAITEHELANYKEPEKESTAAAAEEQQLMPPPPPLPAAAAAQPKKLKLKFKQPTGAKAAPRVAPAKSAAAAAKPAVKPTVGVHRNAAAKAQELAASAAWFIKAPTPGAAPPAAAAGHAANSAAVDPAAAEAAVPAADSTDPAAAAAAEHEQVLLGTSFHGRKRKASIAVREAVEDATEVAAARHSKRVRVRSSLTHFVQGESAGMYNGGVTGNGGGGGSLLAGLGSRHLAAAAAAAAAPY